MLNWLVEKPVESAGARATQAVAGAARRASGASTGIMAFHEEVAEPALSADRQAPHQLGAGQAQRVKSA